MALILYHEVNSILLQVVPPLPAVAEQPEAMQVAMGVPNQVQAGARLLAGWQIMLRFLEAMPVRFQLVPPQAPAQAPYSR